MTDTEKLTAQIDREAKELREAPVVQPILGEIRRCHICGQVVAAESLQSFDAHVLGGSIRQACPRCHPERGTNSVK